MHHLRRQHVLRSVPLSHAEAEYISILLRVVRLTTIHKSMHSELKEVHFHDPTQRPFGEILGGRIGELEHEVLLQFL